MQWLVPRYLEQAMYAFARNQEQMRKNMQETFGGLFPFPGLEELGKQNMALFEKTLKMFSPFPKPGEWPAGQAQPPGAPGEKPAGPTAGDEANLKELTDRLNALQTQIDALAKKK